MKKIYTSIVCAVFVLRAFSQTTTFNYTGSQQTYIVPACVYSVSVNARGAAGGGNSTAIGGKGGRVQCDLPVTPGQTLYIYVGSAGDVTGTPGYNGGGSGIGGSPSTPGSGGGGASDIRIGGTTLTDRKIVAGGGGGATDNGGPSNGGDGGGLIGANGGVGGDPWTCGISPATGGTQSAGGLGGTSSGCQWNGQNGSFGIGGDTYMVYRSAGGGGGWYGGGGAHNGASGGGGSSYTDGAATNVMHTQGFQAGDGQVIITAVTGPAVVASTNNTTICMGGSALLTATGGVTYVWNPGNMTGSSVTVMPTTTTTYTVTVTDVNNCSNTDTAIVNVQNCTGTAQLTGSALKIYPNPFSSSITVVNPYPSASTRVRFYDLLGKEVKGLQTSIPSFTIDTDDLKPGIYFLFVQTDIGYLVQKVVKKQE